MASSNRPPARKKPATASAIKKTAKKAASTVPVAKRPRKPPQAAKLPTTAAATVVSTASSTESGKPHAWLTAVRAAEAKKALDVRVFDLREVTSFCDYFVIASGTNPKQVQAIAEEVDIQLKKINERANAVEGFDNAEWILADYGDFIVHVFSEKSREFYDLERLWRAAKELSFPHEV